MLVAFFAIFTISWLLTLAIRQYLLHIKLLDIPNQRSSHTIPVPRGGGGAIVISFSLALCYPFFFDSISFQTILAVLIPGFWVSILGWFDDRYTISALLRLTGHCFAALIAIYLLDGLPSIIWNSFNLSNSTLIIILTSLLLVWLLNLYNFMDGINGLAGIEALTVCISGSLLYYLGGYSGSGLLPLSLAAAVAGFLCWNFPRAKIFMGDIGSGFLGIVIGILMIQATEKNPAYVWAWLLLLGVFIVDATITLLRRLVRGDRIWEAHCNHAYQHASRRFNSHSLVTLSVLALNVFWLLPMAVLVALGYLSGMKALTLGYIPLILLAIKFDAGKPA